MTEEDQLVQQRLFEEELESIETDYLYEHYLETL